MGCYMAQAAIERGHRVTLVSGPVSIDYPKQVRLIPVVTTGEMLEACLGVFADCDGAIGVAAPCDFQPRSVSDQKIKKTGEPLILELVQTPDIVATLGAGKRADQWVVGFALETEDAWFRAVTKLHRKCCDLVVLNGPSAINSEFSEVELLEATGAIVGRFSGPKSDVCQQLFDEISSRLIRPANLPQ
jgi:phosphopantothenoylcysteine decarboxylase / phosphopantothenate---cysteine ligase